MSGGDIPPSRRGTKKEIQMLIVTARTTRYQRFSGRLPESPTLPLLFFAVGRDIGCALCRVTRDNLRGKVNDRGAMWHTAFREIA